MQLTVEKRQLKKSTETIEVEFPYYAWDGNRKNEIVRVRPVYWDHVPKEGATLNYLEVTTISKSFNCPISIKQDKIYCRPNVHEDFTTIMRNYDVKATEEDFLKFKDETLAEIFK